jgi:hypothetical protein
MEGRGKSDSLMTEDRRRAALTRETRSGMRYTKIRKRTGPKAARPQGKRCRKRGTSNGALTKNLACQRGRAMSRPKKSSSLFCSLLCAVAEACRNEGVSLHIPEARWRARRFCRTAPGQAHRNGSKSAGIDPYPNRPGSSDRRTYRRYRRREAGRPCGA